jgi:hypothetical protein
MLKIKFHMIRVVLVPALSALATSQTNRNSQLDPIEKRLRETEKREEKNAKMPSLGIGTVLLCASLTYIFASSALFFFVVSLFLLYVPIGLCSSPVAA